jgi:transcription antitermination factor NusG
MSSSLISYPGENPGAVSWAAPDPQGWQLVYTVARHEKTVAAQLRSRGIDYFLPVHQVVHQWGARSVKIELPLFPCYVFLRLNASNRRDIITVPGIVHVVSFSGQPATVSEAEIATVQNALKFRHAYPCTYLANGKRVLIRSGPLRGILGVIDRVKGLRVIVSVDCINSSIAIEAEAADLELTD